MFIYTGQEEEYFQFDFKLKTFETKKSLDWPCWHVSKIEVWSALESVKDSPKFQKIANLDSIV